MNRRALLGWSLATVGLWLALPVRVWAAMWNRAAFEASQVDGALSGLGVAQVDPSAAIELIAPDMAENGAIVQIEVLSRIPATEAIAIMVDKNPTPLIANFLFSEGVDPYVVTRIKMAETSELRAIVKAGDRYYSAARIVEVAVGGCG